MAGIYIPGMEMPSCCGECRFLDERGDYPLCRVTDEQRGYNFRIRELRMPHCPLILVPKHGDLIEREPLEKKVRLLNAHYSYREVVEYADIHNAPTIIPADGKEATE